ncbi:hypothetical protein BGX28_004897 [Mortierella sp. GBA30]|nr:hypothetical protein BGX28_004897 [Mortierella sp. GBA30]
MESITGSNGDGTFAKFAGQIKETSITSTSVSAAAPEPSTLVVKLSEDHDNHSAIGHNKSVMGIDADGKQFVRRSSRSSPNEVERGSDEPLQAVRRSRSGRLLRTTVQYDERSSRESSPEQISESQSSLSRRTRASLRKRDGGISEENGVDASKHQAHSHNQPTGRSPVSENAACQIENIDNEGSTRSPDSDERGQGLEYMEDNRDELATDEEQDDDVYGDDGEDGRNEEGSESMDTNSSKNDDGGEPLVVSMYGSPSLVKVRSMFIDKLYKMVEDPSIQHLISWAKEGDMFYVFNCIELSTSVLPKFFKHNNWQSFVRQLNMYGFHKIYRYDREESTMNRRNPETQRWQFYHPDFQRDQPHLRSKIKRKSARSINVAPTFSRVVFERDRGYYVQQESPARPFNGHSGITAPRHTRRHTQGRLITSNILHTAVLINVSILMPDHHLPLHMPHTRRIPMVQRRQGRYPMPSHHPMDHHLRLHNKTLTPVVQRRHTLVALEDTTTVLARALVENLPIQSMVTTISTARI